MIEKIILKFFVLWMLLASVIVQALQICQKCRSDIDGIANCTTGNSSAFPCHNGTDHCFVRNINGIIERGCLETITGNADREICLSSTDSTCLSCPDTYCNGEIWPSCHVCQETTDLSCREAQLDAGTFCTKYSEVNSCYERIVNGKVERGCSSDLVEDPCDGNEQCRNCTTSDCNGRPFRDIQITKCVQCQTNDSDVDGTCLRGTKDATKCTGPSDGMCYSRILDGGVLERGCLGDLTADEVTGCNGTMCNTCPGDGCNSGIYPVDRLRCYQCSPGDCNKEIVNPASSVICKTYLENNKCFSRITSNQTFERGCLSDINYSNCSIDDNCVECSSSNCNNISEQVLLNYPKCLKCSSDEDGCIEGTTPATKCDNPDDSCFVRVNGGTLERNCLSALSPTERSKCTVLADKSCTICTTGGCNNQTWPTCHICEQSANSTCPTDQHQPGSFCANYNEQANCFEQFIEGRVQRGCIPDLDPALDPCISNGKCKSCFGNDCNNEGSEQFQNFGCLQCTADNADSDGSCLLGSQAPRSCLNRSNSGCYSMINDGILERGCQSDISNTTFCNGTSCRICSEEGCNRGLFPENRLECYSCIGSDCDKDSTTNTTSIICHIFNSDNKCYSRITQEGVFERGCQHDLRNGSNPCEGLENCILCSGNKCNNVSENQMKEYPKCLRCTSSDQNCSSGTSNATSCDQPNDSCFTRVKDGILERNCLSTLSAPEIANCNSTEDLSCQVCTGNGCNNLKWLNCHQCNGTLCNPDQPPSESTFCAKSNHNKCFERLEAGNVTRGCANDLLEDPCMGSLECNLCTTDSCNGNPQGTLVTDQRCLVCNSSVDPLCLEGRMSEVPCRVESGKQCYSRVDDDGVLQRGCRGDLSAVEIAACFGENNCTICTGTGCNGGIFPRDRLRCHQCNTLVDESCSNQLSGNAKSSICEKYTPNDSCYVRILNETLNRGCQSDLESSACNITDKRNCQICNSSNCNGISQTKLKNSAAKLGGTLCIAMALVMLTVRFLREEKFNSMYL